MCVCVDAWLSLLFVSSWVDVCVPNCVQPWRRNGMHLHAHSSNPIVSNPSVSCVSSLLWSVPTRYSTKTEEIGFRANEGDPRTLYECTCMTLLPLPYLEVHREMLTFIFLFLPSLFFWCVLHHILPHVICLFPRMKARPPQICRQCVLFPYNASFIIINLLSQTERESLHHSFPCF